MCVFPDMCMNVGICGAPQEARGVRVPYSGEGRLCNAPRQCWELASVLCKSSISISSPEVPFLPSPFSSFILL